MAPGDGNGDPMYRRLEVSPEASAQQIRRAYRRLACQVHPDTHPDEPDASQRFQEIVEAYELLSDPVRRARYDRQRQGASQHALFGQATATRRGPFATGSAPLIAGPVRVESPAGAGQPLPQGMTARTQDGAPPARSPTTEGLGAGLDEFIDALLQPWRWW